MNAFIMVVSTPGLDDLEWVRHYPCVIGSVAGYAISGTETTTVMAWLGKTLLRARPFTLFQHSDGRAKWKGHTGVHLLERRVGGAVIGGALSLRLWAMAVEPGTRSYGQSYVFDFSPCAEKLCGQITALLPTTCDKRIYK